MGAGKKSGSCTETEKNMHNLFHSEFRVWKMEDVEEVHLCCNLDTTAKKIKKIWKSNYANGESGLLHSFVPKLNIEYR